MIIVSLLLRRLGSANDLLLTTRVVSAPAELALLMVIIRLVMVAASGSRGAVVPNVTTTDIMPFWPCCPPFVTPYGKVYKTNYPGLDSLRQCL